MPLLQGGLGRYLADLHRGLRPDLRPGLFVPRPPHPLCVLDAAGRMGAEIWPLVMGGAPDRLGLSGAPPQGGWAVWGCWSALLASIQVHLVPAL